MRIRRRLFFSLLLAAAAGMAAVAPPPDATIVVDVGNQHSRSRVVFANSEINGKPARIMLDTGASLPAITDFGVGRFGLKSAPPVPGVATQPGKIFPVTTEPVRVSAGGQILSAPFPVVNLSSVDAAIGWPEVRDNILVFDSAKRTVNAVPELPAEVAGWLKLKMRPGRALLVDIPLPDGKTGQVLIDTGSPLGVGLPPAQWKEWRAAHPQATLTAKRYTGPNIGTVIIQEGWADEIKIGALTLTDVPVHESPPGEAALFPDFGGTLGLYVLSRMNLVVDGKNDTAYLRPLATPGPPYPSVERPNYQADAYSQLLANADWTVAGNVRVQSDPLLAFLADNHGRAERAKSNFDEAIADFTHAIEHDAHYLAAYFDRGLAKSAKNDRDGAIMDFTHVLLFDADYLPAYLDRGLAREKKGDYKGAIADYNRVLELDPQQVSAYVDRGSAKYSSGDLDGALADEVHALELDPKHVTALVGRGRVETAKGDYDSAIADFDRAIVLDPKNILAFRSRGLAKQKKGDSDGAAADLKRATELARLAAPTATAAK